MSQSNYEDNGAEHEINVQMGDLKLGEVAVTAEELDEAAGMYNALAGALAAEHVLTDEQLEQQHVPEWASQAAVYKWDEDYGDVPPRFPVMEQMLFGDQDHVRNGENFDT